MEMILISRIIRLIGLPFGKSLSLMSNYQDWFKWLITFSILWIQHNTSFIVNQNLRWHNLQNVNRGKMLMNRYSKRNKLSLQAAQAAPKFDLWFNACNYSVKLLLQIVWVVRLLSKLLSSIPAMMFQCYRNFNSDFDWSLIHEEWLSEL